uniref:Uncharacterized protein n=1 Tax=Solanum lycopersicum TaxID=4081 RepID=A0A3Q7GEH7_SOLLC
MATFSGIFVASAIVFSFLWNYDYLCCSFLFPSANYPNQFFTFTKTSCTDSNYKTVDVKLCYAPVSQLDRGWRKSNNNLKKDKTCQINLVTIPYQPSSNNFTWDYRQGCSCCYLFH